MKAPDKIFVDGTECSTEKFPYSENTEYIRKGALLEWLKERIKCGEDEGLMANYMADLAYKDVIDHINQL